LLGQASSKPFRYFDKGNMAVIGAGFAVIQTGRVRLSGLLAWLAWAAVHLEFLTTTSLRLAVLLQWLGSFVTRQTGVRLIVNHIPLSRPNQIIELANAAQEGRK
jgi:NADH dehydrogenase FAD-containing subunit